MITTGLAPAVLPPGQRVYAIGDVHGCLDQLAAMHAAIADDLAKRPTRALVVHLGDYVDRGPDTAGVVERLLQPFPAHSGVAPPHVVNLMGNHEEMLLTALEGVQGAPAHWLQNGGGAALASWKLNWRDQPGDWARGLPPRHLGFLRGLALMYRVGGYLFVHAGIRPGVAIEHQDRKDLLWIREPFLSFEGALPAVVVHGHTPQDGPDMRPNRINVDTGAVMGGPLTCVVLEEDRYDFIQR